MTMGEVYVATLEFIAESDTELGLRVGDRVTVTDRNGQWAYGSIGHLQGWFPDDHVAPADSDSNTNGIPSGSQPPQFPQGRAQGPPTQPRPTPGRFGAGSGGYNTRGSPGMMGNGSPGHSVGSSSGTPGRPGGNSDFANNLKQIQQRLAGTSVASSVPASTPSTPQDDRGGGGYPRPPVLGTRTSGIDYSPAPSYNSAHNNYNGDGGNNGHASHGFNSHQRMNGPAAPPPSLPQPNFRPPGSQSGFGAAGRTPILPVNPPPILPPANRGRRMSGSSGGPPASPSASSKANYAFQFVVEAQHPYGKQRGEELNFAAREKLDIIARPSPSSDWWRARNKAGEIGLVPANYVKEIPQSTPVLAERLWYLPGIKREGTEQRMRRQPTECFVIRDSEAFPGSFTLSVKGPDKVRHIKVTTVTDGYHVGDKKFDSLDAVVNFYRDSPIYIADDGSYKLQLSKPLGNAR